MTVDIDDVKIVVQKVIDRMLPEITSAIAAELTQGNADSHVPKTFNGYWVNKQLGLYYVLMDGFTTIYIGKEWNADKAKQCIELRNRQVNVKFWQPVNSCDCTGLHIQCHKHID